MSYSSTGRVNIFTGNGTATPLVTTYRVMATSEIQIVWYNTSTLAYTALVEGVDYTVSLGATLPSVATITPLAAITSGHKWFTWRQAPRTQLADYTPGGNFPAETHEQALDRLAMMLDELAELETRTLRIRVDDDGPNSTFQSMLIPRRADRISKVLGFDANGAASALLAIPAGSVAFTTDGETLVEAADFAAMRALLSVVKNVGGSTPWANAGAGTIAARPTASTHGQGIYFATDEGRTYYSNGTTWTEMVIRQAAQASVPTTPAGLVAISSDTRQLFRASGTAAQLVRSSPPRYGHGCKVIWDNAQDLSFTAGRWRNMLPSASEDLIDLVSTGTIQKLADATWAAGSGAGGMAAGTHPLAANTWYYAFLIGTASGLIDIGFDSNISATNLLADAAVATWAGGATVYARRIRAFRTKAAAAEILEVVQRGDRVYYVNLNGQPTEAGVGVTGLERDDAAGIDYFTTPVAIALPRIPPGIECEAEFGAQNIGGLGLLRFFPYGPAAYPTVQVVSGAWPQAELQGGTVHELQRIRMWTDTSRRITAKTDSAAGPDDRIQIHLYSYLDPLDRL